MHNLISKKNFIKLILCGFFLITNFALNAQDFNQENLDDFFELMNENPNSDIPSENQKVLTIIQSEQNLNLDPKTSSSTGEAQILNSLYEGLFSYNPISSLPDFALAINFTTSRDGLYWTFTLRNDAKFSNGKQITSKDIKESWLNLLATPGAYYSSFLDIIKGAKNYRLKKASRDDVAIFAKDDFTLSIELVSPLSHFPKILCHHAFSVVDKDLNIFSGPYKICSQKNTELELEKNEFYHSESEVRIPKIKIILSDNSEENSHLFNMGKAQWVCANCNPEKIIKKNSIKVDAIYGTYFFFFKNSDSQKLTKKMRLALLEATPWTELRQGSIFPATTLVVSTKNYPKPAPLDFTDYDHANILIKEAKQELGLKDEEIINLTFAIPEGDSIFAAATILKNAWKNIGVNLEIKIIRGSYYNYISTIDANLFIYTWIGDFTDPIAFLELFRSDSTLNESHFNNKEFDALLDKANACLNQIERYSILAQAEDLLLSEGIVLPITHSIDLNVIDFDELAGWSSNPQNIHPFKNLYFKESKSKINWGTIAIK